MSLTEAQVQFAAEFITLVVTAAALVLVVLRPRERRLDASAPTAPSRPGGRLVAVVLSSLALVVLGAASFAHGSLLVSGRYVEWVGLGRLAAAAVLVVAFPYPPGPGKGRPVVAGVLLRSGFVAWSVAGITELTSAPGYATDALLVAGSALTVTALLRTARRSIGVRVAASAATTLLLVVIVLALALSTVISSSAQREELRRLSARAGVEKAALADTGPVSFAAQLVEADLSSYFSPRPDDPLVLYADGTAAQRSAAAALISARLGQLSASSGAAHFGNISYASPDGTEVVIPGVGVPVASPGLAADPELKVSCSAGRQGLFESGTQVWLGASSPECTSTGRLLGVAVITRPLDDSYLAGRRPIDPTVAMALLSGRAVVATAGMTPAVAASLVPPFAGPVGQSVSQAVGNRFVSVTVLSTAGPTGRTPLYLMLASPATSVLSTREQLFRTLFLIAFGGTVLALGLAVFTGDRITAGLRRLTGAAAAIQAGDTAVRAGVAGDDEVAALGSAFDAMLDSVAAQSTALQAAAEDEARLRNRLEAVVAGMTDALVAVDVYGRITDFNRAAADLTGVDSSRALDSPVEEVVRLRGEDGRPVGRPFFAAGDRDQAMMGYVVRGSTEIPVAVSSGALLDPGGGPVGTVLVFRDMRKEHEVEKMKTEFLSRVGHELRTPLTGIMGYADILLRRDVPAERARSWYEEILHSARRLLRIVEMLEFFASEGAGRLVLRPEPADVRALVNGIASSWAGRLPGNLSLGRRMARSETLVSVDRRWLSLAVDELIDNAVKFSPEGGRILVRVADRGDSVEISVTDQGMGMTPEQHEVVFGEFVQADNSDTRRFGGLGLGLAVVRRVVEGHGGSVRARSAPGRGSTFVIQLPVWPQGGLPDGAGLRNGNSRAAGAVTDRAGSSPARTSPTRRGPAS